MHCLMAATSLKNILHFTLLCVHALLLCKALLSVSV
jgi:hypothetical protein